MAAPDAPTDVLATNDVYTDKVIITWTQSAGATNYNVFRGTTDLGTLGDVATFTDRFATPGVVYSYTVTATNGDGTSPASAASSGQRRLMPLPEQAVMPKGPAYNTFGPSNQYLRGDQVWASAGEAELPTAEALTIASGVIVPTAPTGLYANVIISGEGAAADDLTAITAPAAWIGKRLIIRIASAAMPITFKHGLYLITKTDFTLDAITDTLELECILVNTWIQISRSDNA